MMVMLWRIEHFWPMTLGAQTIALYQYFATVGIVAVATGYARTMHLALQERAHHKGFFTNLPVEKIGPLI